MSTTAQIIVCPNCGAKNRIDPQRTARGEAPMCGRCKRPLAVAGEPVEVSDQTFASEVENSPVPVLVDMWAPWCGPCRMLAPTIDQIAADMAGRVKVAKLNVDENPQTAGRFNIEGIPAMLIFKNGREVDRIVGMAPKPQIAQRLQRFL
jgi:thioredoxin 2